MKKIINTKESTFMIKTISTIIFFIILIQMNLSAQERFNSQSIISTLVNKPKDIYTSDLDGDGYLDILCAAYDKDNKIIWFKNNNGDRTFGEPINVAPSIGEPYSIYAADFDGDNRIDILSGAWAVSSELDWDLAWYRNLNNGNELEENVISSGWQTVHHVESVYAADIDGDNDLDILSASWGNNRIAWYRNNINYDNTFSGQIIISDSAFGATDVLTADINNDGYIDVLSASQDDNKIAWYRNIDGNGEFGRQQIITTLADGAVAVYAADLDGDSDIDVLSASYSDSKIAWYENIDGQGQFGNQQIISISANNAYDVYAVDLDCDGDLDVLSASKLDNKVAWHENIDGTGAFGSENIITSDAKKVNSVHAADLDNDGDMDVLSVSEEDNKIAWYENLTNPTSIQDNQTNISNTFQLYQNYPNPFNPSTNIRFNLPKSEHISLKVYNIAGQEVAELINDFRQAGWHQIIWEPEGLASGIYFVRLQTGNQFKTRKLVLQR